MSVTLNERSLKAVYEDIKIIKRIFLWLLKFNKIQYYRIFALIQANDLQEHLN